MKNCEGKKVIWGEMLRQDIISAKNNNAVVVIPTGSIEQHGPNCPVDVDISIPFHLAQEAALSIDDFPVIIAPPFCFGISHYNKGFPGTISFSLEIFIEALCEVCRSIYHNGFNRIIILNGHGGNHHTLKSIAIKLAEENIFVLVFSHWELLAEELKAWSDADEGSIGHAGEWETSIQLYLRPHLVDSNYKTSDTLDSTQFDPKYPFLTFAEKQKETLSGVMGDPGVASREKGKKYVSLATSRLIDIIKSYHLQKLKKYFGDER